LLADSNEAHPMTREPAVSARKYFPERLSLPAMREAAAGCRGCPLWKLGTQTVFGSGRARSAVMLVGEQPGDEEDRAGAPFVGPAGRELDRALEEAGVARKDAYVTNVVKHFKWIASGKRRLHQKPNAREIGACLPWLEAELEIIRPKVLVCLGATATQALLGGSVKVMRDRGKLLASELAPHVMTTVHPSSILRAPTSEQRHEAHRLLVADLKIVARSLL
jgi:DNA polymerase